MHSDIVGLVLNSLVRLQGSQMRVLLDGVLALFPPMLHRFFVSQWPEPAAWHTSRTAFSRTAAVWCMVGHMLGLGDRHGENIMVDTRTGDCVHIDFACLFDKVCPLAPARQNLVTFQNSCSCMCELLGGACA